MRGSRGGQGVRIPLEKHKIYGFLAIYNTGPDPLKIHKAINPAFNVGHHWHASEMAFRWRANDGPLIVVFGSSHHQLKEKHTKKNNVKVRPPLTKLSGSAHVSSRFPIHFVKSLSYGHIF